MLRLAIVLLGVLAAIADARPTHVIAADAGGLAMPPVALALVWRRRRRRRFE